MNTLLHEISRVLRSGESVVLATIVSQHGSTPRLPGAKMIVKRDGKICGTIGGGVVEADVIQTAQHVYELSQAQIRSFDLSGTAVTESMDVICGGAVDILIEPVAALPENLDVFEKMASADQNGTKSHYIVHLGESSSETLSIHRWIIKEGEESGGDFPYPASWLEVLTDCCKGSRFPVVFTMEGERFFVEPIASLCTAFLFGAGHVSQKAAELAKFVGFRVVVLDDRTEFANRDRFPRAEEVIVVPSFDGSFADLTINATSYIVIVTRGHAHDKTVLAQALQTHAGYIGMIGSRKKRDAIYQALLEEGYTQKDLSRVYSPIGLNIGGETPEEIALSIVAELVHVRNKAGSVS